MIPYEELVIALQTWRAKQGLPVGQLSGALTPPHVVAPPLLAGPPVKPPKIANTGPQQAFLGNVATPPPLAALEDAHDVDDAALIEEAHYAPEGADAVDYSGYGAEDGESTVIGDAPRPSTFDDAAPVPKQTRNDDW